jgi:hypothetical protein
MEWRAQRTEGTEKQQFQTKRLEADQVKKQADFRGGIDCIAHVLPPDVQRALHAKLCNAAKKGEKD